MQTLISKSFSIALLASLLAGVAASDDQPPETEKQPVFLFCPHKESVSAWSLYLVVDKKNPSKPVALGLEELTGKNSKDLTYKGVLTAQKDPSTQRNEIARLDAGDFGRRNLEVKENEMLSIGVNESKEGLKLTVDARVGLDKRFVVGGAEREHRDLILKYSTIYKCWQAIAPKMEDVTGRNAVGRFAKTLTGIIFTAGATGVSRIAAVDEFGSPVVLFDK